MGFTSIVLLGLCLLVLGHRVRGHTKLSKEEDLEIEKQLKLLNKPAVETIQVDGDIFDCVDINKQPALDHQLLKHHVIKMKPSSYPIGMLDEPSSFDIISHVGLKDRKCPQGTVLIKRVRKEDLIRKNFLSGDRKIYHPADTALRKASRTDRQWAVLVTEVGNYYGAAAYINVYGHPQMPASEHTSSEIWVINDNGGRNQSNIVQAGWTVDPKLFGDTKTRLFTQWTGDSYKKSGCYNILCPGFIQVSANIPLGLSLEPVSTYNGSQYEIKITLFRDPKTKDWWLTFFGREKAPIGYWPSELFTGLSNYATRVDFGGYISYPPHREGPPMGSGHFPDGGFGKACFFKELKVANQDNTFRHIEPNQKYIHTTSPDCYKVGPYSGYGFFFGGPGGCKSLL